MSNERLQLCQPFNFVCFFVCFFVVSLSNIHVAFAADWIDTTDRRTVINYYLEEYKSYESTPPEWEDIGMQGEGEIRCPAVETSDAYKDATLRRVNYFRGMAGVPSIEGFTDEENRKARQAALIMSFSRGLSHNPSPDSPCYTAEGLSGAANSNLALGNNGWDAVSAYMWDNGSNNAEVGHRRWVLYPPKQTMGVGDAPSRTDASRANALWVTGGSFSYDANSQIRDGQPYGRGGFSHYVAWPPPGYVPYQVTPERWSFSQRASDFSNATVSIIMPDSTSDTPTIESKMYTIQSPDSTIVWNMSDYLLVDPSQGDDMTYIVQINNVGINCYFRPCRQIANFSYEVTLIDPIAPDVIFFDDFSEPETVELTQSSQYPATLIAREAEWNGLTDSYVISNNADGNANLAGGTITSDPVSLVEGKKYRVTFSHSYPRNYRWDEYGTVDYHVFYYDQLGDAPLATQSQSFNGSGSSTVIRMEPPDGTNYAQVQFEVTDVKGAITLRKVLLQEELVRALGANLLENPDFTTNSGWTAVANSQYPSTAIAQGLYKPWGGYNSQYDYTITNSAKGSILSPKIDLEQGHNYEAFADVSAYGISTGGGLSDVGASFHVLYYDSLDQPLTYQDSWRKFFTDQKAWVKQKIEMNVPNGAEYARIQLSGDVFRGAFAFDNIEMVKY